MSEGLEDFEMRVRFEEADPQGVVFFGNYFTYQDETLYEYLREIGYPNERLQSEGWDVHVVHAEMDFKGSARFEDTISNSLTVTEIGESSITVEYSVRSSESGDLLASGEVVYVAVDADGHPTSVSSEFRAAVRDYQGEPSDVFSGK
ncbi:acyl-CoA thioesterase [Halorussus salinisoli]|uniref:acyl-CoA thioesterase n=1 Tax=Halorussus salinisoli TaxID=2558242 RepID=UPI0010C17DF4|nr:thioesterase family protein [Halorussus salinisoli]